MTKLPTPKEIKSTSLRLLIGLPIVGLIWTAIIRVFGESQEMNWYVFAGFAFVGLSVGTLSLLLPAFGRVTYFAWHKLIYLIDQTIIWTTLPLFYYVIFCPYSLLIGLFGKSKLKKRTVLEPSYWKNAEQPKSNRRYIQQF
ncbi:MAG: hypothetical protein O2984_07285 [Bacteroidetes bacterium]|nr:hypothetical protein [Bacteroidota bacterium]